MRIYPRSSWAPAVGGRGTPDGPKRELYIHHSAGTFGGPAQSIDTGAEQEAVMRALDRFHTVDRGWAGIAYSYVVFQPYGRLRRARVFEGRGAGFIPAAQLGHNTGTIAVCVVDGGRGDELRPATRRALTRLARQLKREHGITRLGGHRDAPGQSTECPGPYIYPALSRIARVAGLERIRR
jgi:hypothetical protein